MSPVVVMCRIRPAASGGSAGSWDATEMLIQRTRHPSRPGELLSPRGVLLAGHLLTRYSERCGKEIHPLSSRTLAAHQAWSWPGNVRELENTVNQVVLLGELERLVPPATPALPDPLGPTPRPLPVCP